MERNRERKHMKLRRMKDTLATERDAVIGCYCQYSRSTTGAWEEKMVQNL